MHRLAKFLEKSATVFLASNTLKKISCNKLLDHPSSSDFLEKHWPIKSTLDSFAINSCSTNSFYNMLKLDFFQRDSQVLWVCELKHSKDFI